MHEKCNMNKLCVEGAAKWIWLWAHDSTDSVRERCFGSWRWTSPKKVKFY